MVTRTTTLSTRLGATVTASIAVSRRVNSQYNAEAADAGPSYYGADYSYGYGDPSFYSTALTTPSWGLSSSLRARYSPYYSSTSSIDSLPYYGDDLRFREAADLSYYQQKLQSDRNLQDAERMMLWKQRQEWQTLDEESRRLRWMEMDELTREVRNSPRSRSSGLTIVTIASRPGTSRILVWELPRRLWGRHELAL
jgi:hypothetical protein